MNNSQLAGAGDSTGVEEGSELAALMSATGLSEADARALWTEMGMGEYGITSHQQAHSQQAGGVSGAGDNQALRVLMAQQQAAADQLRQQSAQAAQSSPPSGGRQPTGTLPATEDDPAAQERAAVALELVRKHTLSHTLTNPLTNPFTQPLTPPTITPHHTFQHTLTYTITNPFTPSHTNTPSHTFYHTLLSSNTS